jgi:hypothetical protein
MGELDWAFVRRLGMVHLFSGAAMEVIGRSSQMSLKTDS